MKKLLPWLMAACAYVVPPVWAYFAIEQDYAAQRASHRFVCGTPALGMMLLACIGSGFLSAFATLFRGWTIGWWRSMSLTMAGAELTGLLLPFLGAVAFAAYLVLS